MNTAVSRIKHRGDGGHRDRAKRRQVACPRGLAGDRIQPAARHRLRSRPADAADHGPVDRASRRFGQDLGQGAGRSGRRAGDRRRRERQGRHRVDVLRAAGGGWRDLDRRLRPRRQFRSGATGRGGARSGAVLSGGRAAGVRLARLGRRSVRARHLGGNAARRRARRRRRDLARHRPARLRVVRHFAGRRGLVRRGDHLRLAGGR